MGESTVNLMLDAETAVSGMRDLSSGYLMKHIPIRDAAPAGWQINPSAQVQDLKLLSLSAALACWT